MLEVLLKFVEVFRQLVGPCHFIEDLVSFHIGSELVEHFKHNDSQGINIYFFSIIGGSELLRGSVEGCPHSFSLLAVLNNFGLIRIVIDVADCS